jgi:hypothetical protein
MRVSYAIQDSRSSENQIWLQQLQDSTRQGMNKPDELTPLDIG